jgi:diguanylate cyclase (GGDEF)-like protein
VVLWTVCGTLGCVLAALWFDSFNFTTLDDAQRFRAILTDVLTPTALAIPTFYFFSSKLRDLAIAHRELALSASTDSLTALLNRGAFTSLVDDYLSGRAPAHGGALLVIDIDHFKRVNDSFGHDRGDEALQLVAATIKGAVRAVDLVGRLGGEEFGVFLPGLGASTAEAAAERIRQAIADAEFLPGGMPRRLTVSIGGAVFDRDVAFKDLYRLADSRLYAAKNSGRNRVCFARVVASDPPRQAA